MYGYIWAAWTLWFRYSRLGACYSDRVANIGAFFHLWYLFDDVKRRDIYLWVSYRL
jgi:hypothetical protein